MAEASWTHRTSFSGITSLFLSMKQFGVMVGRQLLRRKGSHLVSVSCEPRARKLAVRGLVAVATFFLQRHTPWRNERALW